MTAKQLQNAIASGHDTMYLTIKPDKRYPPEITIPVDVSDARQRFDRLEVCVKPIGGSGSLWVTPGRLSLCNPHAK